MSSKDELLCKINTLFDQIINSDDKKDFNEQINMSIVTKNRNEMWRIYISLVSYVSNKLSSKTETVEAKSACSSYLDFSELTDISEKCASDHENSVKNTKLEEEHDHLFTDLTDACTASSFYNKQIICYDIIA